MRRHIFIITSAFTLLLATACTIDAYDKGEGEYSLLTAEMADVAVGSDKLTTAVDTDQGERLQVTKPATMKWMEKGDTTYRALVYYKVLSDGKAEIVSMSKVGVARPRQLATKDGKQEEMKTDPVYVESMWMSKNKKYVNMRLRLLTGSTDDEKAVQTLSIISETADSSVEKLVLYHDQGGQPEYYSTTVFVSIPLDKVKANELTITVNTYDGRITRTFSK